MSEKIKMTTPLVELDGDEMTRILWGWIKELLLEPFIELKTEYYDLGLRERERTRDEVTRAAAEAIKHHGVGVKCANITPNSERMTEYGLSALYKSSNATIRAALDGTVFRAPIICKGITPYIPNWQKPITIARHAFGDLYKGTEFSIANEMRGAKVELVVTRPDGQTSSAVVNDFNIKGSETGIAQGIFNTDSSIESFARACMNFAIDTRQDLWFGVKDTISVTYDRRFRDIFEEVYQQSYRQQFEDLGIEYFYSLIDDIVARVIRSNGGFIWACRNYDGDVMSDMVATAFGSLAMMTSVLVSPQGQYEFEAAHGTVQRHYYQYLKGERTSTNSTATIFAWSGALRKRGELDGLPELVSFANRLEAATLATIEQGVMTGDLYALSGLQQKRKVDTRDFLLEVVKNLASGS